MANNDHPTRTLESREVIADWVAIASFALACLAILSGVATFLSVVLEGFFDPFQYGMVIFPLLSVIAGIVSLLLRTRRRALAGLATGMGIVILLIPVLFIVMALIASTHGF